MRKMFMAILAFAAASSLMVPERVYAQGDGVVQEMTPEPKAVTRAARLRTTLDPVDPDTVWIGHIDDPTYTAGGTMQAGGYGPYHVGRGPNLVVKIPNAPGGAMGSNGTWGFDRYQPGETDSLQGWWPIARCYQSGATTFGDFRRAFQGLDYGNQVNYVINQGSPKRTFGVTGLWHRDKGNKTVWALTDSLAGNNIQPTEWSPTEVGATGSTASCWMGLRSHGDLSHRDLVTQGGTGNPFDASLLQYQGNNGFNQVGSVSSNGTDHNFPGYGSQMDQMLYRDVRLNEGDGLNISFNFSTNMSLSKNSTTGVQIGWFDKDPLSNAQIGVGSGATASADGNFISATGAGADAPCDSFMVYVGAPVNDADVTFSDGSSAPVYDLKRRWFSEILRCVSSDQHYKEIRNAAGQNSPTPVSCNFGALYPTELQDFKDQDGVPTQLIASNTTIASVTVTSAVAGTFAGLAVGLQVVGAGIPAGATVTTLVDASTIRISSAATLTGPATLRFGDGGRVRIVFRVKTNRGFDDENAGNPSSAHDSGTRGAAIIDNVVVNNWVKAEGNFENATGIGTINNDSRSADVVALCNTTSASTTLTSAGLFGDVLVGDPISGAGIPALTTVVSKASASSLTMSLAATATAAGVSITFDAKTPLEAWKSTGKPPAVYFHVEALAGLTYDDPCGSIDNPNRACNMYGRVLNAGDHDNLEKDAGVFGSNTQDRQRWFASPTINLSSTANGSYNAMGIDLEIANATGDYISTFDLYNAGFVDATTNTGQFYSAGYQSYPARQINGNICWGETRHTTAISFWGAPRFCATFLFTGAKTNSLIRTTNAANKPDSLRLYIHRISRCYSFTGLNAGTCAPTGDVAHSGAYFDNLSLAIIDSPPPPGISIPIWMLINDAFPANTNDALIPAAFDTCAAQIRIGINNAAGTGDLLRNVITGDTMTVTAGGASKRLDLVFRILPGPGNYMANAAVGGKANGVATRPDLAVKVLAVPGDGSFFGEYMANPGEFSSTVTHAPPSNMGHTGGTWQQDVWNSARCDTIENNLFPTGNNAATVGLAGGVYASMYHESDPKVLLAAGRNLGINKWRCFMENPAGATTSPNIKCAGEAAALAVYGLGADGLPPGGEFPDFVKGRTREYTKIIPDGLLTPGSHVQYFFRKSTIGDPLTAFEMGPDTNFTFQGSESNFDRHRWQQFGVLPDRWKDGAWPVVDRNAPAPACMLYVDWNDRRGDERSFVSMADTIGLTAGSYIGGFPSGRWGAHNGWHARGDQSIIGVAISTDPTIAVYKHGGQPGTLWDMFGIKATESSSTSGSFGSRSATPGAGFRLGKETLNGPSGAMLRNYYRVLLCLTGDLSAGNIGPYIDKGDNDTGLLNDYAQASAGAFARPRAVWFQGQSFVDGQIDGGSAAHPTWINDYFGADLASYNYREYAVNPNDSPDLFTFAPVHSAVPPAVGSPLTYGVVGNCFTDNDVLTLSGTFGAAMAAKYEDSSSPPLSNPKIASIYVPSSLPGDEVHPQMTLVDGFDIQSLGTRSTLQTGGLMLYYWHVVTNLFGSLNCVLGTQQPVGVGDMPNSALVNFLALRSENPFRNDKAKITFGITRKEKVELKVYDVTGRLVKTLANREFDAGSHDLFWDGSNDDGQLVSRGVYFYQLRTPSFVSQKKLAVLKN